MGEAPEKRRARLARETPEQREQRLARERARRLTRRLPTHARKRVDVTGATQTWRDEKTAREDLERRNHVRALIDSACAAAVFDPQAARPLATRDLYADACGLLTKTIKWPGMQESPQVILWRSQNDSLLAFQLVAALHVAEVTSWGTIAEKITREWLRERPECEPSRVCLALMGECYWPNAGPRERAGYLLHHVVEARR